VTKHILVNVDLDELRCIGFALSHDFPVDLRNKRPMLMAGHKDVKPVKSTHLITDVFTGQRFGRMTIIEIPLDPAMIHDHDFVTLTFQDSRFHF
jgi:hypothetical protein